MIYLYKYFKHICKYFLFFGFLPLFNSCGGGSPVIPVYDPEITATISGEIDLNFAAAGVITISDTSIAGTDLTLTMSTVMKSNGIQYSLGVYIIYQDKIEKTGTFDFTDKKGQYSGDYAVGSFVIGTGSSARSFITYWGKVTITKIQGQTITGTFYYKAREVSGTAIVDAANGIINFTPN